MRTTHNHVENDLSSLAVPQSLSARLHAERAIVVPLKTHPLELSTLDDISGSCDRLTYQSNHSPGSFAPLYRGRVKQTFAEEATRIVGALTTQPLREFLSQVYNEAVEVTDIQVNRLRQGEELRGHQHGANDKFAVLHLSQTYEGGFYYDTIDHAPVRFHNIPPYSLLLSLGDIFHGVTRVTSREPRTTIVMFLEEARGSTGRPRE